MLKTIYIVLILIGPIGGLITTALIVNKLFKKYKYDKAIKIGGVAAGILVVPVALAIGMISGPLGGRIGDLLKNDNYNNINGLIIILCVSFVVFGVVSIIELTSIFIGSIIGIYVNKIIIFYKPKKI